MMKQRSHFADVALLCASMLMAPSTSYAQQRHTDYPIAMVDIKKVELTDSFWLPRIRTVQRTTIAYGFDKCDQEGRLESFLIAGKKKEGKVRGKFPFDDSDIYKVIEGASLSLISAPNKQLDAYLDSIIAIVKIGQEPDGYLTTWFTIDPTNPVSSWVPKTGARWTREQSSHELYNSGHMFEAAVAHYTATGKRNFLDIAIKNADLLVEHFGPGKLTLPPGHQVIETGLVKLYRVTGDEKYLKLAKYYLDWRGDSTTHRLYGEYSQDHKPVVLQDEIVGHAVRAVYMYAGMTDVAALYNDSLYFNAVMRIWHNMVERKMYLTGGIGAKHEGESLGKDYELPNLSAYGETCASIGDVYWNTRLFMLTGDAKYFDVIERTLYNGLISGLSLDGKNFFYTNPLEANGIFKFNEKTNTRQPWFDCSCCPTNLIRFIPSLPGLIYATQKDTLYVNLYASNNADVKLSGNRVKIEQQSEYPWNGTVKMQINPEMAGRFTLMVRIPGWAQNRVLPGDLYSYSYVPRGTVMFELNGKELAYDTHHGYAAITRSWQKGDNVTMYMPMDVRRVVANARVKDDENLTALERGPLVYCVEGIDNENRVDHLTVPDGAVFHLEKRRDLLGGISVIVGNVRSKDNSREFKLTAIPYYAWSNRGAGAMKVWLPRE